MQNDAAHPAGTPPYGTAQRIRTRAIWAVALFTASLPPALIGFGIATATADPPEEPPGVRLGFQGLRVIPYRGLSQKLEEANSESVVLPRIKASAWRNRRTISAS